MIELKNVSKAFGTNILFSGLTFDIKDGEYVELLERYDPGITAGPDCHYRRKCRYGAPTPASTDQRRNAEQGRAGYRGA